MDVEGNEMVRSAEWQAVRQFAEGVRSRPAALVIAGEAGAGKSTLWRAGVAVAGAGHRVLRIEPSATEADLAFTGLSDLLTGVLPEVAEGIPGPQREALEVALLLRPAGAEPPTARAVGLAVLAALRGLTTAGPVLVAIDDVHWLDEASREALTFAFRRADETVPAGLLLAARTAAPADPLTGASPAPPEGWRHLAAAVPAETVDLGPLDDRQIRQLLPVPVTTRQARRLAEQSRGNPFWAREIAASLAADDTPVPALARTLTDRLARTLSPEAGEALAVVAAAGRLDVSDGLMALEQLSDPAAALDEVVLAGLVIESAGRLSPAHPLIGAAAVESLPPGRRQRLYRRLAAGGYGPERYAHFVALAAGPGPDEEVAVALDLAAEAAHTRAGNTEAAQFAAQAVEYTAAGDDKALTRRRIRAAELLFLAGDVPRSLAQAAKVSLGDLATPDLERLLPLRLDLTDVVEGPAVVAEIIAGLAAEPGGDQRRRALVLALVADAVYGLPGRRREAAAEAIRSAEAAGPAADATLHRALLNLAVAQANAGDGLDHSLLDRAEELETRIHLDRLYDTADMVRGVWSQNVGQLDTSRAALRRIITRARDVGDDFSQAAFLSYLASTENQAGDYPAARAAVAAISEVAAWLDRPLLPLSTRCELLIAEGNLDAAQAEADQHLPDTPGQRAGMRFRGAVTRGRISAWRGDAPETIRWLEAAADVADDLEFADPGVRMGLDTTLAEAYLAAGRPGDARPIAAWLREVGERLDRPTLTGNACRIDAQAAALDGDLDAAADLAERAVAAHESSPQRLELPRSLLVLGQIERRRRARGRSRAALIRARDLARALGHQTLLALIEQELPRSAGTRSHDRLTPTEQQVADLITAGATNRDAAAALFVSVRTVETHVASIYRKLGVRNRTELARQYPETPAP